MPPRIKKRGRPKGHELTTIGLPAKKDKGGKLCAFTKLHTADKEKCKFPRGDEKVCLQGFIQSVEYSGIPPTSRQHIDSHACNTDDLGSI